MQKKETSYLNRISVIFVVKDTVFIALRVPRGSGHVQQDEPSIMGFIDNDLVELDGCVHPSYVGVIPVSDKRFKKKTWKWCLSVLFELTV